MKFNILLLSAVIILNSCQQFNQPNNAKPVAIDGLGSLVNLREKTLSNEQLLKVVKTVVKLKSVNDDDARSLLEIYRRNGDEFLSATIFFERSDEVLTANDVENFLHLIARHSDLAENLRQATQNIILDQIKKASVFNKDNKENAGSSIGNLAGIYVVACRSVTDTEDGKRKCLNDRQADNMIVVVQAFEESASDIFENKRTNTTSEQKDQAKQFLTDLKTYNDSLPADEKILDSNGRLINPNQMTDQQQTRIHALFGKGTGTDYGIRLSNRMNKIWEELRNATAAQVN